jgi:hypothetical protein
VKLRKNDDLLGLAGIEVIGSSGEKRGVMTVRRRRTLGGRQLVYNPSDLIIREASIADHQAISLLYAQVDALHANGRPDAFQEPPQPRSIAFLQKRLAEADAAMLVADIGGAVVGFAFVKLWPSSR